MAHSYMSFSTTSLSWSTNNNLQTQMLDAPDDVANAASQAVLALAQTFLMNVPTQTGGQPSRNTKVANPERFYGS